MGAELRIEISEIDNGILLEDSFFGCKLHFKKFPDVKKKVIEILDEFEKERDL